jgi:hypothetical protein
MRELSVIPGSRWWDHGRVEMIEVQVDVVLLRPDPAPLADFDGHGPAHHVAARQIFGRGGIALHEAFAVAIGEVAAFPAHAFGDEAARAIDAGGMELNKLHVLQRQAGSEPHAAAITGAGMRRGAREERAAVASGGQHHHMRAEAMDRAVLDAPGDDAAAGVTVHDQVEHEILN